MRTQIEIYDRFAQALVTASFHDDVTGEQLAEAEAQWKPFREAAVERLLAMGKTKAEIYKMIQHVHWDWARKAQSVMQGFLGIRCFGIEREGKWQGLTMLELAAHQAQLEPDKGKSLVYVEFLESAPWNLREMCDNPQFGLVGFHLIRAAVYLSIQEEFHGRVGLLALPQAEDFYRKCHFRIVEGAGRMGMKWHELTKENAKSFLGEKR